MYSKPVIVEEKKKKIMMQEKFGRKCLSSSGNIMEKSQRQF